MQKASLNPEHAVYPVDKALGDVAEFLESRSGGAINDIFCQENSKGLLVAVTGERKKRFLVVDLDLSNPADGVDGELLARDLENYVFDSEASVVEEQGLYRGLLSRGDLAVWLGREKHRKSNLILQFAICAALGRDFLGFKFVGRKPLMVVLIDFESRTGSLKKRYDSIVAAMGLREPERAQLAVNLRVLEVRRIRKAGRTFPKFPAPGKGKDSPELAFWNGLVELNPADLYIIDPLRTLHSTDENDSSIEGLLSEIQRVFRGAAVILAHHMRKQGENSQTLVKDMRAWSDGARGSSAIKASADVIVLQERSTKDNGDEIVHLGAFLKDDADIEPITLMESDHESFYWEAVPGAPAHLQVSYDAIRVAARTFNDKASLVRVLKAATGVSRATAHRHIVALIQLGMLVEEAGTFRLQTGNPGEKLDGGEAAKS